MLHTPNNPISLALTLRTLGHEEPSTQLVPTAGHDHLTIPCTASSGAISNEPAACVERHSSESSAQRADAPAARRKPVTFLGSMLFKRGVSGTRVVARGKTQTVAGHTFKGYGAHCDAYPCDYLTVAAALGTTDSDMDEFIARLKACIEEFHRT